MAFDNWGTSDKNSITENNGTNMKLIPNWSGLSRIGRNKIMQYTVLVPVFGYFIIFSDWLRENLTIYNEFPEWNLYFTYYGLTFLAVASLIYGFRCPEEIKSNETASEFVNHDLRLISRNRLLNMAIKAMHAYDKNPNILTFEVREEMLKIKNSQEETPIKDNPFDDEFYSLANRMFSKYVNNEESNDLSASELMLDHYLRINAEHILSRTIVFILYIAGFCILAIPTLSMFAKVTCFALDSLSIG